MVKLAIAAFLVAHAALHASFLSPRPAATSGGPEWPFDLARSRALTPLGLDPGTARLLGVALVAVTLAAFVLAAFAVVGIAPAVVWAPALVVGAAASLVVLGLFFHPWLVLGVGIDVALIWAAVVARWMPA